MVILLDHESIRKGPAWRSAPELATSRNCSTRAVLSIWCTPPASTIWISPLAANDITSRVPCEVSMVAEPCVNLRFVTTFPLCTDFSPPGPVNPKKIDSSSLLVAALSPCVTLARVVKISFRAAAVMYDAATARSARERYAEFRAIRTEFHPAAKAKLTISLYADCRAACPYLPSAGPVNGRLVANAESGTPWGAATSSAGVGFAAPVGVVTVGVAAAATAGAGRRPPRGAAA